MVYFYPSVIAASKPMDLGLHESPKKEDNLNDSGNTSGNTSNLDISFGASSSTVTNPFGEAKPNDVSLNVVLKYLSPAGSMIKFWMTTFR